jgi:hypothetical protein
LLKIEVKVKLGIKVAQSYEMVRNFNNFKAFVMFAVKKLEALLIMFFLPPPRRQHFREKFVRLGQNPRKCWSKHDDRSPPQC